MSQDRVGGPRPSVAGAPGQPGLEGPPLPKNLQYLEVRQYGVMPVTPKSRMEVRDAFPEFLSIQVSSPDGKTLYSHSDISEHGNVGTGHRSADTTSYGSVPRGESLRITLEHADGWYTARLDAPKDKSAWAGERGLQGVQFEWIPRPVRPPPAGAPPLRITPRNLHLNARRGLEFMTDDRGPLAALKQPLPGFTGVELRSRDGQTSYAWSDVSELGNIGGPKLSRDDASGRSVNVPANDSLELVLHHPDGEFRAILPQASGGSVLRTANDTRKLARTNDDFRFTWHPKVVDPPPTGSIADILEVGRQLSDACRRASITPANLPGAARVPEVASGSSAEPVDWGFRR